MFILTIIPLFITTFKEWPNQEVLPPDQKKYGCFWRILKWLPKHMFSTAYGCSSLWSCLQDIFMSEPSELNHTTGNKYWQELKLYQTCMQTSMEIAAECVSKKIPYLETFNESLNSFISRCSKTDRNKYSSDLSCLAIQYNFDSLLRYCTTRRKSINREAGGWLSVCALAIITLCIHPQSVCEVVWLRPVCEKP